MNIDQLRLAELNKATPDSGQQLGGTEVKCPFKWTLIAKVEIAAGYKYNTQLTIVQVNLDGTRSDSDHCQFDNAESHPTVQFHGNDVVNFRVTAVPSDDNWQEVKEANVSLAPGDNKTVSLQVRSRPWICVKLIDDDKKITVDGVTVYMDLPGKGKDNQSTAGGKPCYWNHLNPGTAKFEKMEDPNQVWEMIRIESA